MDTITYSMPHYSRAGVIEFIGQCYFASSPRWLKADILASRSIAFIFYRSELRGRHRGTMALQMHDDGFDESRWLCRRCHAARMRKKRFTLIRDHYRLLPMQHSMHDAFSRHAQKNCFYRRK